MTKADGGQQRNNQPMMGAAKAGGGGDGDGDSNSSSNNSNYGGSGSGEDNGGDSDGDDYATHIFNFWKPYFRFY